MEETLSDIDSALRKCSKTENLTDSSGQECMSRDARVKEKFLQQKVYGELYILATDEGYLNEADVVWEKLTDVLSFPCSLLLLKMIIS
ncbi:hypothetical protein Vadar_012128 [Vaccinium darrowii]|uniref:Uncharacterized protein n=1 Tax=Vaccinium darrowii TaxID=229202 RepID=A0ACB7X040_9ERIC|nr:hypothetical protein Vadar_012128 [Vaccinium darrowii]